MAQEVKERPILFSGPMVQAILNGSKTQTRRIIKRQPSDDWNPVVERYHPTVIDKDGMEQPGDEVFGAADEREGRVCPYGQPGDLLWVRETWGLYHAIHWHDLGWEDQGLRDFKIADAQELIKRSGVSAALTGERNSLIYAADGYRREGEDGGWKPSIHMPRWASRILLRVTGVRVERLQDITEEDAKAEGCSGFGYSDDMDFSGGTNRMPRNEYRELWGHINGPGSWGANPWVWVVEFERVAPTEAA